jgi:D-3-phosphoglycerate dehydrogenase
MKNKLLINLPASFHDAGFVQERYARAAQRYDIRTTSHNTPEEIAADLAWPDAILMWSWPVFTEKEFGLARNLKFLAHLGVHPVTVENALKRGVALSETRHCWSPAVSEMALGLMLNGLRHISEFHMKMRSGEDAEIWARPFPSQNDPTERQLTGRTVGVVGFGAIGRRLAELLKPFNTELLVYDPFVPKAVCDSLGARQTCLDEICARCEVIVLCAANVDGAEKLVNADRINAMQKNTVLVNVGRSFLIDMDALAKRLAKNDMFAMLDVFDREPLEADSVFRSLPNAYLSPHHAGGINESICRAMDWLFADIDAFFDGKPRKYAVTENLLNCFPTRG